MPRWALNLPNDNKRFADIECWLDELPPHDRAFVETHCETARRVGEEAYLLPLTQGLTQNERFDYGKRSFLSCKEPISLIRVSDTETGILSTGCVQPGDRLAFEKWISGYGGTGIALRADFISAIRECDLVGLHPDWPGVREMQIRTLLMLGFSLPYAKGVEFHLPYKLLVDRTLFEYLSDKRVLLIGFLARKLAQRLADHKFLADYSFLGPIDKMKVAGVIETTSRDAGGSHRDYGRVVNEASKIQYDVTLLSCGTVAKPLAWRLWKQKKTALDVGFVFDALCGDGERQHRPALRDIQWPSW
jgi:hypothetical protein